MTAAPTLLFDAAAVSRHVAALAEQIGASHADGPLVFVGIEKRGVVLARRVAAVLAATRREVPIGTLDISLYRDDLARLAKVPELRGSQIPFDVDGASVVLFDDVLFTGRTIRAALEELMDFGRPARVELAVLLDRGRRELPIQPDFCPLVHQTAADEHIRVRFAETDGEDGIVLSRKEAIS